MINPFMFQCNKIKPIRSRGKQILTEGNSQPSLYQVLTHSSNLEYRVNRIAQAKLQINPIYRLNSVKNADKDGLTLHQKQKKALYFRKRQKAQNEEPIRQFLKSKNQPLSMSKIIKSTSAQISLAFRQKMKKNLKYGRTNLKQQIQNQPFFTGSSVLLHRRSNNLRKSRQNLNKNRSQLNYYVYPTRQYPIELPNHSTRGRSLRQTAYQTQRNGEIISPWQGQDPCDHHY